ncbi:MAG TPA: class I SAM-dependent methyltransferase [Burkholderiaceae bacterium]
MRPRAGSGSDLLAYYAARAREYERIYDKPERQADLRVLETAVAAWLEGREVVEIACGTGYWTRFIAPAARRVLALDANPETLEIARAKALPPEKVRFDVADAYALEPSLGQFDAAFAGFWWSHVPRDAQPAFLASLRARLVAGAVLVMLDNRYVQGSSTPVSRTDARGNTYQLRRLHDGSAHEVLKNFPSAAELRGALREFAEEIEVRELRHYWLLRCRVR